MLILVGAGPGDPDLITVKGAQAISEADVILYDSLANPGLLKYAGKDAEKIFVGKKAGSSRNKQSEINRIIVEKTLQNKKVVRLKGGDPCIFGRCQEEIEYARSFGIETKIIPGVSSCTSLAEIQNIPLTRRGMSESFWVTTGMNKDGMVSEDIRLAAQSSATIVVLMGMTKLKAIVRIFQECEKGDTPVAVIQNGTLPEEKVIFGSIDTIYDEVQRNDIESPALILIGEVVTLHPEFCNAV